MRIKDGRQAIGNRLKHIFDDILTPIDFTESDNRIRTILKKEFNFPKGNTDIKSALQIMREARKHSWRPESRQGASSTQNGRSNGDEGQIIDIKP